MRLRRRLNTVLLQWFLLLVGFAGTVWAVSLPGIRRNLVDERVLLARTIAQAIDTNISTALLRLNGLAADLPRDTGAAAASLRPFRFESIFTEAIYIVDAHGVVLAADPADAEPIDSAWLSSHEAVTAALQKKTGRHVLAMVQPVQRNGLQYYLVAETALPSSLLNAFLKDLEPAPSMRVDVIDDRGLVIASADPREILRALPDAASYGDRIRAHRLLVREGSFADLAPGGTPEAGLAVMAPLRYAAWGVVIQQRSAQAFSGLAMTSRGLLFTGVLLAVTGVLLARTLSRSVVKPIRLLSRQAEAMRGGDLKTPITVTGDDEVASLARTLDDARVRLASTMTDLQAFNRRLEEQVAARTQVIVQQDEQRKSLLRRMLTATEDERRRVARELHDEIAQLLTVIQLSLHNIREDSPDLDRANELLVKTQREIHRIIHDLRPAMLDDLGLAAAMRAYADEHLTRRGVQVSLEIEPDLPSRPEIETVVFRIYQELVTNILRHAGADSVSIELYESGGKICLAVEDDGRGFDPDAKSEGVGMTGMRERADLVNGTIRFDSEADMGTHVLVEIPLQ